MLIREVNIVIKKVSVYEKAKLVLIGERRLYFRRSKVCAYGKVKFMLIRKMKIVLKGK